MAAVIGALRADLSAGWAEFATDMGKAADSVKGFGRTFRSVASDMRGIGATMAGALTVPIALAGAAVVSASKDFEAGMNRVKAATGAAGAELDALREKAREVGVDPQTTVNAIEAADGMEILAKNGLEVAEILGGALDATTKLAAATGSQLAPAADVATDVMLQFGKAAGDLGPVVDGITGTLLASKFGFDDYRLALGQAGGVAGGLGVEFTEFNAVIAATSALFASGSDAGTSYKTFLTSLSGNSVEAKRAIDAYGLAFYNADGSMRGMAEIAGELREKLGGLNDEAKTEVLKRIFGTDAMRTAIGLMNAGAEGIRQLDETIQAASAQEQMDARMAGLSGSMREFGKAATELKLAIGDSGLLDFLSDLVKGAAELARNMASLPGPVLATLTALAGLAAVVGPLVFVAGAFMAAWAQLVPLLTLAGTALAALPVILAPLLPVIAGVVAGVAALVGVWLLVRDQVMPVLEALGERFQTVLGPTLTGIVDAARGVITAFGDAFKAMAAGPLGAWFRTFQSVFSGVAAIVTRVLGEVLLGILNAVGKAFTGLLNAIAISVRGITALLRGDLGGALDAMGDLFMNAVDTVLNILDALLPGSKAILTDLGKFIGDLFTGYIGPLFSWVGEKAMDIADGIGRAVGPAVAWAKSLYDGVAGWIADKLGPLIAWCRDRIAELRSAFNGLVDKAQTTRAPGETEAPRPPAAPARGGGAPAARPAPPPPAAARDIGAPGGGGGAGRRGRQGPTLEELERQHEMDVARAKADQSAIDALADREERTKRIESYLKAGLSSTEAQARAEREVTQLAGLRAAEYARNIVAMEEEVRLTVAEATENHEVVRAIERQREQRDRTLAYQREGVTLAEAERRAAWDIAQIEQARATARERWRATDADRIALANAQARGDQAEVERLQSKLDLEARIQELRTEGEMTPEAARAQAEAEAASLSLSELIGKWREFSVVAARQDYLTGMAELNRLLEAGVINADAYAVAAGRLTDTLHEGMANASPMFKEWSDTVDLVGDALGEALKPGADLKSIWESFRMELLKILVLEPLITKFKRALKSMGEADGGGGGGGIFSAIGSLFGGGKGGGGGAGGILSAIGSFFGGFRARGGGVMGGRAYMVGEEGPELFAPGKSGAIVPNDALTAGPARGVTIHAPVTVHATDAVLTKWVEESVARGVGQAVEMAVPAAVKASIEAVPAEMAAQQRDMF